MLEPECRKCRDKHRPRIAAWTGGEEIMNSKGLDWVGNTVHDYIHGCAGLGMYVVSIIGCVSKDKE